MGMQQSCFKRQATCYCALFSVTSTEKSALAPKAIYPTKAAFSAEGCRFFGRSTPAPDPAATSDATGSEAIKRPPQTVDGTWFMGTPTTAGTTSQATTSTAKTAAKAPANVRTGRSPEHAAAT